mmetsp:Transcript_26974/g.57800  ORF Transcript_26974/g.57800 Transcript_26974/m.57800 type:complete len:276 (-) Transcript_26974:436-1263(-)
MSNEYLRCRFRPLDLLILRLSRGLTDNTTYPRVGIQHVRRRVPIQTQHSPITKFVVRLTVHGEVGVFDGTNANCPGHFGKSLRQFLLLRISIHPRLDILAGNAHGLIQQILQLDRIPRPSGKLLPILALYEAKGYMFQGYLLRDKVRLIRRLEHHFKVLRLPRIRHVQDPIGLLAPLRRFHLHTMPNGRQVRGGIVEPPVRLSHEHGKRRAIAVGIPLKKHGRGTLALHGQSLTFQIGNHTFEVWIVKRFSAFVQIANVQPVVNLLVFDTTRCTK